MSATITPFVFEDPTYIIKAVDKNMKSPVGRMVWPTSGSVDDTRNFVADKTCGAGLYGFTIDHLMAGDSCYMSYFDCPTGKNTTRLLILEVERSEIVNDGSSKCKVPRCNVVGCYEADEWQVFCAKWSHLLGDSPPVDDIIEKFSVWIGSLILTDAMREDLRDWASRNTARLAGDGCSSEAERKLFEHYVSLDFATLKLDLDQTLVLQIAHFMCTTTCAGARMSLWAKLQRSTRWLFAVHPHIEKIMVATAANGGATQDKYDMRTYQGWNDRNQHPVERRLDRFSEEDQKEIRLILANRESW